MSVEVVLYGAPGCHLCDDGQAACSSRRRAVLGYELRTVDISGDAELEAAHRAARSRSSTSPGGKAFKYRVDPAELRRRVFAAASQAAA